MGANGVRIEGPEAIAPAVSAALRADAPAVIDFFTDSGVLHEPYRRDALKMPVRVTERYRNDAAPAG